MLEDSDVGIPALENTPPAPVATTPVAPVEPTPEPKPEPKVEAKPAHPSFLETTAANLGIPSTDIKALPTPELERLVAQVSRFQMPPVQQQQFDQQQFQQQQPPPQEQFDWGMRDDGTPAKEDDYGAPVRQVKKIPKLEKENQELKARLEALEQRHIQKSRTDIVDDGFDSLGKEFVPLVGKGRITNFQKDDPEVGIRTAMLAQVGVPPEHPEFYARLRKVADKYRQKFAPVEQTNGHQAPVNRVASYGDPVDPAVAEWNQGALATTTARNSPKAPQTAYERNLEEVRKEREAIGQVPTTAGDPDDWLV